MEQNIKVSVIVPIYRVAKFLPKCIESIQKQDYENLEIILVDDGSDDDSGNIADQYAATDKRIVVLHKQNGGVSSARNAGLGKASGEYICFVDGDDYVMSDYVSYLLSLSINSKADISLTSSMFGNFDEEQIKDDSIQRYSAAKATELMLCYRFPIGVYCRMFKRVFLEDKHIKFNQDLFIGEGFNFNTDAIQRANIIAVGHRKIYFYRRDNESSAMSSFSEKKWLNGLHAIEVIHKNLLLRSSAIEKAWQYAWWRTNSDAYDSIVLAGAKDQYTQLYNSCRRVVRKNGGIALQVPISKRDRMRAIVMMIFPSVIPFMMKQRKRKYIGD